MSSATYEKRVAKTIIKQLGGRRFQMMTGAKKFYSLSDPAGIQFRFPSSHTKANTCAITYDDIRDSYTMTFYYIRGGKCEEIEKFEDVYFDMLTRLYEDVTGMKTRLY